MWIALNKADRPFLQKWEIWKSFISTLDELRSQAKYQNPQGRQRNIIRLKALFNVNILSNNKRIKVLPQTPIL